MYNEDYKDYSATAPWPTSPAARQNPARAYAPPPAPHQPAPAQQQYSPDPSCVIRGLAKEIVDDRTVNMNGELVETAVLILETSPGRIVPVSLWGQKKCEYVRQGLGKVCDIVFTVGCQTRQVQLKDTGETTTIYNASLKLKSCLWT